jgi:diguanylate cyclase (GGDEF)-like protein
VRRIEKRGEAADDARRDRRELVLGLYVVATGLLVAYAVTLFARHTGHVWPVVDDQLVAVFEVAVALGCLARGLSRGPGRRISLVLGAGLLAWALGDIAWRLASSPSTPSVADAFFLAFYPLAALSLILLLRFQVPQIPLSSWLDGAIAAFGAAAICIAFAIDTFVRAISGSTASTAVNLAYSVGDVVLLALAVAVVVMVPQRWARVLFLVSGSALMALGNIVYLSQASAGTYRVGTLLDLTWPAAMLAMSASVWLRSREVQRSRRVENAPRVIILVPVVLASLMIVIIGNVEHVSPMALGLAGAALVAAIARRVLALREQKRINESRKHQAVTDELTGLGNRRYLLDQMDRALAALPEGGTSTRGLALLLIDLDHFKEINDSFGHQIGDALLRQIGPRIRKVVRHNDLVARLGGDEFAVLLHGADAFKATTVALRITKLLEQPIDVSTASLHVGASIGVALAPEHARNATDLLRCADIAMYRAKTERGSFDIYDAALDDEADRFALIEDLRLAMADGSLALHYQPEIDLQTGQVVTVEALLRWPHPTLGLIPPEHLLALAEESGLVHALAAWVFKEAIADCARWWSDGHEVAVAVNLLATDLLDSSLPRRVGELLALAGLPPRALVLEITEGMVMADLTRSKRVIEVLADSNILVSIDDFGTGFSSLSHLNDLAVGELKLDRTFTSRLQVGEASGRDEDIVRSIIDLGHALGLRVVAEGIERLGFVDVLAGLGCDIGQGYAIQTPCPASQINFAGLRASQHAAEGAADDSR